MTRTYHINYPGGDAGYEVRYSAERGGWEWVWLDDGEPGDCSEMTFPDAPACLRGVAWDALESICRKGEGAAMDRVARSLATRIERHG